MRRAADPAAAEDASNRRTLRDRILAWRDGLLASPDFQRWATRFPLTRAIARRRSRALFDICAGFVYAQVLSACVQLRVFETLARAPLTTAELARRIALPVDATARLLLAAVSLKLLERRGADRFGLGVLGAATLGNPGIGAMVAHHAVLYRDLADPVGLLRGDRRGELARFWPYAVGEPASEAAAVEPYTRLMSASQPLLAEHILDAYPLRRHMALLDVGGGDGTFLLAAARRAPELRLTLFDLPPVAALAEARFAGSGFRDRTSVVAGDFRREPLPGGHDLVSLIRVLHDHDDPAALALLRAVRAALPSDGTLLLAEPMAETADAEAVGAYFALYLLAMGSGRPRSFAEIRHLLEKAGFAAVRHLGTSNPMLVRVVAAKGA